MPAASQSPHSTTRAVVVGAVLVVMVAIVTWAIGGPIAGRTTEADEAAPGLTVDWEAYGADGEIIVPVPRFVGIGRTAASAHLLAATVLFLLAALVTRKLRVPRRPDPMIEARSPFLRTPAGSRAPPFCVVV